MASRQSSGADARKFLGSVPFFAEALTAGELDVLAAAARRVDFDRGATVLHEHDPGNSMLVVLQGSVTVSIRDSGMDRRVATLRSGDIVGEMSLLTGAPRTATVAAQAPMVAVEIDRAAMRPLLDANPELSDRFAAMLEKRQAELDELYGPGLWPFPRASRASLAALIRAWFADPPAGGVS